MNAKTCKKLRRAAERATIGNPQRTLVLYLDHLINLPGTTRATYRAMKKAARS